MLNDPTLLRALRQRMQTTKPQLRGRLNRLEDELPPEPDPEALAASPGAPPLPGARPPSPSPADQGPLFQLMMQRGMQIGPRPGMPRMPGGPEATMGQGPEGHYGMPQPVTPDAQGQVPREAVAAAYEKHLDRPMTEQDYQSWAGNFNFASEIAASPEARARKRKIPYDGDEPIAGEMIE